MKAFKLNPALFGVPQTRSRLWMPCFSLRLLHAGGVSEAEATSILDNIMCRLCGSQPIPLTQYLLSEAHPLVQQHYVDCLNKRGPDSSPAALAMSGGRLSASTQRGVDRA
eukprot:2064878-Alexandrium_andersonii.AAC.1